MSSIDHVGAGHQHSVAISSTGIVYTWGRNLYHQLGDGTAYWRNAPAAISDVNFEWKVASPRFNITPGTYNSDFAVTVWTVTSGATIHYTQNGNEPTTSDPAVVSGNTVTVSYSQTLKAKAFKTGMPASNVTSEAYALQVVGLEFSPNSGTYTSAQNVTIATTTPGATIRYTTDGSTPSASSSLYTGPVNIGTTTVLKAIALKTDWLDSAVTSGTYTMNFGTLATPTADQPTGEYVGAVNVTLSSVSGATIRYTINNTAVQESSAVYTTPLILEATTTLRFKAFHPDYIESAEVTRTYTLTAAAPTFDPEGGVYPAGQEIEVTSTSSGAAIHYTINGAEPTTSDPTVSSGSSLVAGNFTLKAKAFKTGNNPSTTTSETYSVLSAGAAWGFEDGQGTTAADSSGNGNTATLLTGASWTTGRIGSALSFDGVNDAVEVADSDSLDFTTAMTVSAWIKLDAQPVSEPIVVKLMPSAINYGLTFEPGYLKAYVRFADGDRIVSVPGPFVLDEWLHVAATFDGMSLRLYVNGELCATEAATGTMVTSTEVLRIGSVPGEESLPGAIDEVRLYDRALSIAEILFDMTQPADPGTPLQVTALTPAPSAMGIRSTPITATFSAEMDETSLSATTVRLETLAATVVSTTHAYDAATRTISLTPTAPLLPLTGYRVVVAGGASGVASVNESTLAATVTWTFTTAAADGLGAFWSFEEGGGTSIVDGTGNGNTGSLLNGPTWTVGRFGGGLSFDDVNDRVRVPHSDSLNFTASMSMSAWIKLTTQPTGKAVLSKEAPTTASYQLSFDGNNHLHGYLRFPDGMHWVSLSTPFPLEQWIHVAVTYDGSLITLYIDGVESGTDSASGSLVTSNRPLWIGGDQWGDSFPGLVDEVRLYDRALSAAQISALSTEPPSVSVALTSPFHGTTFNAPSSVLLAASASITGGTISRVDFITGSTLIGSASTAPYATTWVSPSEGVHVLTAVVVDSTYAGTPSEPIVITIGSPESGEGTLGTPIASPDGGLFSQPPDVTLVADPTADIRYTLDGSEPSESSAVYTAPIAIPTNGSTLKARAFKSGWTASETMSAVYERDTTSPYLNVTSPSPRVLVPSGALTVTGTVLESVSTATVTCEGTAAEVADDEFSCEVEIPSGTSTVDIVATDEAGNARTVLLEVTTSDQIGPEPTALRMTPQNVTLGVGEKRRFRATDDRGRVPADAEWTIDNEALATLVTTAGVAGIELTAVAPGDVTITANWHGQSATSVVSIVTTVVAGTTLWSNPPLLGGGAVEDVVRGASPPNATRLLYAVEAQGNASLLRAFSPDGQEIWTQNLAGRIYQVSGDALGGAVVLLNTNPGELPEVRELHAFTPDGRGTFVTNADSPGFAIHPDGPLYIVVGQQLKGIDIGLGQGRTVPLPTGTGEDTLAGVPTVLADGSVTLPLTVYGGANSPGASLDLLWLRPSGTVDVFPVDRDPAGFFQTFDPRPHKAIPNGLGGVLVAYDLHYYFAFPNDEAHVRLVNADGSLGGGAGWGGSSTFGTWLPGGHRAGKFVLGEDRIRATGYRFGSQGSFVRVSDISLEGHGMGDFYVPGTQQPRFTALEGGEFFHSYADGTTWGTHPDHETVQLAHALYAGDGTFLGSAEGAVALRAGGNFEIANSEWPEPGGTSQTSNSPTFPSCASASAVVDGDIGYIKVGQPISGRIVWEVFMSINVIGPLFVFEDYREVGARKRTTNMSRPYWYYGVGGSTHGSRGKLVVGSQYRVAPVGFFTPIRATGALICQVQ